MATDSRAARLTHHESRQCLAPPAGLLGLREGRLEAPCRQRRPQSQATPGTHAEHVRVYPLVIGTDSIVSALHSVFECVCFRAVICEKKAGTVQYRQHRTVSTLYIQSPQAHVVIYLFSLHASFTPHREQPKPPPPQFLARRYRPRPLLLPQDGGPSQY